MKPVRRPARRSNVILLLERVLSFGIVNVSFLAYPGNLAETAVNLTEILVISDVLPTREYGLNAISDEPNVFIMFS